ncbi:hypothetical protein AB0M45_15915 [Nocardia sp. NPDC051787]|uniref:hypothetical protein n=1 Tax=Nocardia sp. NPDC051787 TaxID=3155415 RepID=UPI00344AEB22
MAPPQQIRVDPQVYYDAARKCHELAHDAETTAQSLRGKLAGLGGMAGHYDGVAQWAADYDKHTGELVRAADTFAAAMFKFGDVLNASGYNHALANWRANKAADKGPAPTAPVPVSRPVQTVLPVIRSAGSNGPGLETNVPRLLEQVGMKLPDGHADKLSTAATAWNTYANDAHVTGAAGRVKAISALFDHLQSDEITEMQGHLHTLHTGAMQLAENSTAIAQPVGAHQVALGQARSDVDTKPGDLKRELALTVTVTAVVIGITMVATAGLASAGPAEAEGAAGAAAFAAAVTRAALAIRNAITASRLFTILGVTAAYAAFQAVPHDLTVITAKLAAIMQMRVFVDNDEQTKSEDSGGTPGAGAPSRAAEVESLVNSRTQPGKTEPHRQVETGEEIRQLYEELTRKGEPMDVGTYPGQGSRLPDGTEIRIRDGSKSGGVTIDIKYPGNPEPVKVHIPKR